MDRPPADGPDERYERIPWEHLMPPPGGDRRRWLLGGAAAMVVVAVIGFSLGAAGDPADDPAGAPTPLPAQSTPPVAPPDPPGAMPPPPPVAPDASLPPATTPLPTEADLRATTIEPADPVADALAAHLASVWTTDSTAVDHVTVRRLPDGRYRAVVAAAELGPAGRRPVDPIGVVAAARLEGDAVVVDQLQPVDVPTVAAPVPAGAVGTIPDPVREAIATALGPWPTASVAAVGMDAGRWWVETVVGLPGGATVSMVLWPDLGVGLGTGG